MEQESNLVRHARTELDRAGWFNADSDYGGLIGPTVLDMVKQFAGEGHSGCSAGICLGLFKRVAAYKLLTPINNPMETGEYVDHSESSGGDPVYQSTRLNSLFSNDGGKHWHDLDGPWPRWKQILTRKRCYPVKFPYLPK